MLSPLSRLWTVFGAHGASTITAVKDRDVPKLSVFIPRAERAFATRFGVSGLWQMETVDHQGKGKQSVRPQFYAESDKRYVYGTRFYAYCLPIRYWNTDTVHTETIEIRKKSGYCKFHTSALIMICWCSKTFTYLKMCVKCTLIPLLCSWISFSVSCSNCFF